MFDYEIFRHEDSGKTRIWVQFEAELWKFCLLAFADVALTLGAIAIAIKAAL